MGDGGDVRDSGGNGPGASLGRRRRATFNIYVGLPDEYGADELEVIVEKLIKFFATGEMAVLSATWSCPEIGRKTVPSNPVLVFRRTDDQSNG